MAADGSSCDLGAPSLPRARLCHWGSCPCLSRRFLLHSTGPGVYLCNRPKEPETSSSFCSGKVPEARKIQLAGLPAWNERRKKKKTAANVNDPDVDPNFGLLTLAAKMDTGLGPHPRAGEGHTAGDVESFRPGGSLCSRKCGSLKCGSLGSALETGSLWKPAPPVATVPTGQSPCFPLRKHLEQTPCRAHTDQDKASRPLDQQQ